MNKVQLDRALNHSVAEGALATVMGSLLGGVFLTGFALQLGATRFQIGVLAALPTLANLAQIAGARVLETTGRPKELCVAASWASRLLWLPIALAPIALAGWSGEAQTWFVVAVMALSSAIASVGGVAWLTWTKSLVPADRRIEYLGRRNLYNTGLAFGMSIAGACALDAWGWLAPGSMGGFIAVFVVAMLCGAASNVILAKIPEVETPAPERRSFFRSASAPLGDATFRRLVAFYAVWNLASNLATPFFAVFMLQKLGLPFWAVTLLATLSSVVGLATNHLWTNLKSRFGVRPIVALATFGDALLPFCWLFVSPETIWLLIPIHLFGVFSAPLTMGPTNALLKLAPEKNAAPYLALFNATTGAVTALGAILGGWLAGELAGTWAVGPLEITGIQLLFLISGVGRLASLLLLQRIPEPDAESTTRVVRVLHRGYRRRLRSLTRGAAPPPHVRPKPVVEPACVEPQTADAVKP